MNAASDQGKLFVGGISWDATEDSLTEYFSKYGEVVDAKIMKDRHSGTTRGFGFVQFSDPSSADKVLQEKEKHVILGRTVEVKKAIPRAEQHHYQSKGFKRNLYNNGGSGNVGGNEDFRTKKIFVGGLSPELIEEEFRSYFEKFGVITDVVVMYDNATQRPRGFGFITFDSEEAVEAVLQKNFHELNNKMVEVKRAVPREGNNGGYDNGNYYNNNGYDMGGERGSFYNGYHCGMYPPYNPGYGYVTGYGQGGGGYIYGAAMYGAYGYQYGAYGGMGYAAGMRGPYVPGMAGYRGNMIPYNNTYIDMRGNGTNAGEYQGMAGNAVKIQENEEDGGDDGHWGNGGNAEDDSSSFLEIDEVSGPSAAGELNRVGDERQMQGDAMPSELNDGDTKEEDYIDFGRKKSFASSVDNSS